MTPTGDLVLLVYLAVGAAVCVITWLDNYGTHYVMGDPPSGIFTGLTWPIIAVATALAILVRALSKDTSK